MPQRLPPLESLHVLEACVRHGSFTQAAQELAVTPAAISLRIRNLEAQLGTRLFRRRGPRLEATPAACRLAERLSEALHLVETAVHECRSVAGRLRLTVPPSFATQWLAPRLHRYYLLPNAAAVQVDASMELRAPEEFDVAIRTGSGGWPSYEVTPLAPIEATPMLSPSLASSVPLASPRDLAQLPLLRHPEWPRWFREASAKPRRLRFCPHEFSTHELDAAAALEGVGVALLPRLLFARHLAQGKLIQPFTHVIRSPSWHCLLLKRGVGHPATVSFKAWLQGELLQDG